MSNIWQDDPSLDARLRELWDEGHSTAEIGRRMGISKNAVVGRAHRIGLHRLSPLRPLPPGVARAPRKDRPVSRSRPLRTLPPLRVVETAEPPAPAPAPPPIRKSELRCQWLEGNGPWRSPDCFCGEPVHVVRDRDGELRFSSWCPAHHARAYVRVPPAEVAA